MQSKSRIDPTMKVVDGPARHSSTPAAKRDCARAPDGAQARTTNAAASAPAERIMAVSPGPVSPRAHRSPDHHNRIGESAKTGRGSGNQINIKMQRQPQGLPLRRYAPQCVGAPLLAPL